MRRQFDLPSFDVNYLTTTGLEWETVIEGDARWLLIHERAVVAGYNAAKAIVALRIAAGYPEAQLDMAYFYPALARADGKGVNNLTTLKVDGKDFQQWSRHRTAEGAWRSGEDDVSTHMVLVDDWLEREFARP